MNGMNDVKLAELSNNSSEGKNVTFLRVGGGQSIRWLLHIFRWSRPPNPHDLRPWLQCGQQIAEGL